MPSSPSSSRSSSPDSLDPGLAPPPFDTKFAFPPKLKGAFQFPLHSQHGAQHFAASLPPPSPTSSTFLAPAGFNPDRRRSSSARKPTPVLSPSLEDLSVQEEMKSRSSMTSSRSQASVRSGHPVENADGLSNAGSAHSADGHDDRGRPRTSFNHSSGSNNNNNNNNTQTSFVPPSKPPPPSPSAHLSEPSPDSAVPIRKNLTSWNGAASSTLIDLSQKQPYKILKSGYVRAASPGTATTSPSRTSQTPSSRPTSPLALPPTPPTDSDRHGKGGGGLFGLLGKKKSTSRPNSSGGRVGSPVQRVVQNHAVPPLSPRSSTSSLQRKTTRDLASPSPSGSPSLHEREADEFESYSLTDFTPPTSIPFTSSVIPPSPLLPSSPIVASPKPRPFTSSSASSSAGPRRRNSTATQCSSVTGVCNMPPAAWDLSSELNAIERRDRRKKGVDETMSLKMKGADKEGKKEKKERLRREEERFDPDARPTAQEMFEASLFEVIDGEGRSHMFGDLIKDQRTIVVFIRHWYCPLCSDYVYSVVQNCKPADLERAGAKLIIIGNGDHKVVHVYKDNIFECPFEVYTDPTLELYRALGMTRQTGDGGAEEEKGDYVKHGTLGGTLMVARNLGKMGRKGVTLNPGHFTQLGGEFVLGPGLAAHYTHRMHNTRGHASIKIAMAHAGVAGGRRARPPPQPQTVASWTGEDENVENRVGWKAARDGELERMRTWREERRRGRATAYAPEIENIRETIHEGSDDGEGDSIKRQSKFNFEDGRLSSDTTPGQTPYSLRHHRSVGALQEEREVVKLDEESLDLASEVSPSIPTSATFGFPPPPSHIPFSPTLEVGHPFAASASYSRSATIPSSPIIVDLASPSFAVPPSPALSVPHSRSSSSGTMGFPNDHSTLHLRDPSVDEGGSEDTERARTSLTLPNVVQVPAPESETSSFSRRDSNEPEEVEGDGGSEDSSYDREFEREEKMVVRSERMGGMGSEEFGGLGVVVGGERE